MPESTSSIQLDQPPVSTPSVPADQQDGIPLSTNPTITPLVDRVSRDVSPRRQVLAESTRPRTSSSAGTQPSQSDYSPLPSPSTSQVSDVSSTNASSSATGLPGSDEKQDRINALLDKVRFQLTPCLFSMYLHTNSRI
jgi:hypothetical protein